MTYRVPVEVELEIETGEIINVHIMDEKLEGLLGVFNYVLVQRGGRQGAGVEDRRGGRVARLDFRLLALARPGATGLVPDSFFPGPSSKRQGETEHL
ncbi:MAG: hypothetical protein ABIR68_12330 [Ilumatobacteraceae bacterium]